MSKENTIKIVINTCYGCFSLSREAYEYLGLEWDGYGFAYSGTYDNIRSDPKLVECVEKLGEKADGKLASLKVVEIPSDVIYEITDNGGIETVEEVHRKWS